MKDWKDIQAIAPQETGPKSPGSQDFRFEAPSLPTISLEIIRVLLAGLMAVLGLWNHVRAKSRYWDNHHAARVRYAPLPGLCDIESGNSVCGANPSKRRLTAVSSRRPGKDEGMRVCAPP